MITLYIKNRPWGGEPRCDYVRVISARPPRIVGYRLEGGRLISVAIPAEYLVKFRGWYHPATAWEIQEYRGLRGDERGAHRP